MKEKKHILIQEAIICIDDVSGVKRDLAYNKIYFYFKGSAQVIIIDYNVPPELQPEAKKEMEADWYDVKQIFNL